jgi:serine/threonine protein kinase
MTRGTLFLPPGTSSSDIIGGGTSGLAILYPGTRTVLKISHGDPDENARCELEAQIYDLLSKSQLTRPSSLLEYKGRSGHGILLGYAENHTVRRYLRAQGAQLPDITVIYSWAEQATVALHFLHMNGISHGDVTCDNFFLDKLLNVQLGDFTSSSFHLGSAQMEEDIFKFGLALYEMCTGVQPFKGMYFSLDEKRAKFLGDISPDLSEVKSEKFKSVISKCPMAQFKDMEELLLDQKMNT